jgi:hypothetical protein
LQKTTKNGNFKHVFFLVDDLVFTNLSYNKAEIHKNGLRKLTLGKRECDILIDLKISFLFLAAPFRPYLTPMHNRPKMKILEFFSEYTECFTDLGKFDNGGLILSSSQFSLLTQLPQKIKLASKVAKIDSKYLAC